MRCFEEQEFERSLSDLVGRHEGGQAGVSDMDIDFFCFWRPFDLVCWLNRFYHSVKDTVLELRWRVQRHTLMMIGWHDVEIFAIPHMCRAALYVNVPSWLVEWESPRFFFVPTAPVYANWFNLVVSRSPRDGLLSSIARTELSILTLMVIPVECPRRLAGGCWD